MPKNESGISKAEAKDRLKKAGYNVIDDNSVVTVLIPPQESIKKAIKDIREKLLSWNYNSSFGVRHHIGDNEELEQDNSDDMDRGQDTKNPEEKEAESPDKEPAGENSQDKTDKEPAGAVEGESQVGEKQEALEFDENDLDMILNEDSIQMSFGDFGLN